MLRALALVGLLFGCGPPPDVTSRLNWSEPVAPSTAPAHVTPRLRVEGTRLFAENDTAPIRLRGVNVCSFEFDSSGANWQLRDGGSETLDTLAADDRWNVNVVRVPVNQQWFLEDESYVARVERVVDAANARGVYAIVDVQWESATRTEPYSDNILELPSFGAGNTTEAFWLKATSRWATRSNVLYDLINEAHGHDDALTSKAMQSLVSAIRSRDERAVIVVSGMDWAHSVDFYRTHPLAGANLLYSAHQYLPYDQPSGFDERFARAAKVIPVIIGEFLSETPNASYAQTLVDTAEREGVNGWLPWAVGCGFGVDDDSAREPSRWLASKMRELNR